MSHAYAVVLLIGRPGSGKSFLGLERLAREHRVAFVHVRTARSLCAERVVSRPPEQSIHHVTDPERSGGYYDLWQEKVAPSFRFDRSVGGDDVDGAVTAIRELLGGVP